MTSGKPSNLVNNPHRPPPQKKTTTKNMKTLSSIPCKDWRRVYCFVEKIKKNKKWKKANNKDESSIGAVNVCNRLEIVLTLLTRQGLIFSVLQRKLKLIKIYWRHTKKKIQKKIYILIKNILHLISTSVKCILWQILNENVENQDLYKNKDKFKFFF